MLGILMFIIYVGKYKENKEVDAFKKDISLLKKAVEKFENDFQENHNYLTLFEEYKTFKLSEFLKSNSARSFIINNSSHTNTDRAIIEFCDLNNIKRPPHEWSSGFIAHGIPDYFTLHDKHKAIDEISKQMTVGQSYKTRIKYKHVKHLMEEFSKIISHIDEKEDISIFNFAVYGETDSSEAIAKLINISQDEDTFNSIMKDKDLLRKFRNNVLVPIVELIGVYYESKDRIESIKREIEKGRERLEFIEKKQNANAILDSSFKDINKVSNIKH